MQRMTKDEIVAWKKSIKDAQTRNLELKESLKGLDLNDKIEVSVALMSGYITGMTLLLELSEYDGIMRALHKAGTEGEEI